MEVLVAAETSDNIAMVQVWIPPGGGLPEHDHGPSEIILVHLSGSIELRQGDQLHRLAPGAVAQIATGERVSLTNPGTEPAVMMIVASPPEFVARIAWLAGCLGVIGNVAHGARPHRRHPIADTTHGSRRNL